MCRGEHLKSVVSPRPEHHVTVLFVEREVQHVNLAVRFVDGRRRPQDFAGILEHRFCHQGHFVIAVGAVKVDDSLYHFHRRYVLFISKYALLNAYYTCIRTFRWFRKYYSAPSVLRATPRVRVKIILRNAVRLLLNDNIHCVYVIFIIVTRPRNADSRT